MTPADVPLRDAAQALLTAWDEHIDSLMACGDDDPALASANVARTMVARETAVEALRAALAAADTAPTPPSAELERQRGYSAGWHAGRREALAAADGTTPTQPDEVPARFRPDWAVHPGEILQEEIDERGMTQVELAGALGCAYQHVNRICRGHVNIEAPFAVRLERVLGISAELWLGLQQAYDLHHARRVVATPATE